MLQIEMIELVRQHHPHLTEKEIRKMLDRAFADFAFRTEMLELETSGTIEVNKRYYDLPTDLDTIKRVRVDNVEIARLAGNPSIDDTTDEG